MNFSEIKKLFYGSSSALICQGLSGIAQEDSSRGSKQIVKAYLQKSLGEYSQGRSEREAKKCISWTLYI